MSHPELEAVLASSTRGQATYRKWFASIAEVVLNRTDFMVQGAAHRFLEIEFYFYSADHPDLFAHRDPVQIYCGRWYFHRTGGTFRGGSFKGSDMTFGDGVAYAGILFRSLKTPSGEVVDGPSLLTDYLLKQTGFARVADLDRALGTSPAWDATQPLALLPGKATSHPLLHTARVGLTLKRHQSHTSETAQRFVFRRYRFLSEPHDIRKGRPQMVLALHTDGIAPPEIQQRTGCTPRTIERYIACFQQGASSRKALRTITAEIPKNAVEFCRLYGALFAANRLDS